MTDEEKKKIEDIIIKKKIYVYDDVVALMGLPRAEVRKMIRRVLDWRFRKFEKCPYCNREIIITG